MKNDELRGLGGFGRVPKDGSMTLLVRGIVIPLAEPSVVPGRVLGRRPLRGPRPGGQVDPQPHGKDRALPVARRGPHAVADASRAIALLFGDNPDTGRDVGRLDALAVFINQAGVALENAFLQRKLQALQGQ